MALPPPPTSALDSRLLFRQSCLPRFSSCLCPVRKELTPLPASIYGFFPPPCLSFCSSLPFARQQTPCWRSLRSAAWPVAHYWNKVPSCPMNSAPPSPPHRYPLDYPIASFKWDESRPISSFSIPLCFRARLWCVPPLPPPHSHIIFPNNIFLLVNTRISPSPKIYFNLRVDLSFHEGFLLSFPSFFPPLPVYGVIVSVFAIIAPLPPSFSPFLGQAKSSNVLEWRPSLFPWIVSGSPTPRPRYIPPISFHTALSPPLHPNPPPAPFSFLS